MAQEYTVCAQADAANVIAILQAAPYNHTYVTTYGPFDHLNQYPMDGLVGRVGIPPGAAAKVIVHTTSP